MELEALVNSLTGQIGVAAHAPIPFVACVIIAAGVLWKVIERHHAGVIEMLKQRINLRDDQIAHLKTNIDKAASEFRKPDIHAADLYATSIVAKNRVFVDEGVTIEFLTRLHRGRTQLQTDKFAEPYIGKWIELDGEIEFVTALGSATTVTIRIFTEDESRISAWMMFPGNRHELERLQPRDPIQAIGKIERIEVDQLKLVDCQLL